MTVKQLIEKFDYNLRFHFAEILNEPLAKPYWIFISLSHRCNFNCQMCGVKKILKGHELELELLKKTLKEIAGWKSDCVIVFTGGEPFLRDDIFEIIEFAVSLGLKIELVNNGSQINNPGIARKIIKSGLQNIAISLDGFRPETHDYIRGVKGAYQMALGGLGHLVNEKRLIGSGPQISVWTTIMNENVDELYEMIDLVRSAGVECLVYHPVIVAQDDMQNTIKSGQLWIKEENTEILRKQIDKIASYQKQNGLVAFLHDPYLWIDYFKGSITKKIWKCNPFAFIDIGPDGFVRSCGQAFGNIRELTLSECLDTDNARKAREIMTRCTKPCLQTCWAMPEADSLVCMTEDFVGKTSSLKIPGREKKAIIREGVLLLAKYEELVFKKEKNEK